MDMHLTDVMIARYPKGYSEDQIRDAEIKRLGLNTNPELHTRIKPNFKSVNGTLVPLEQGDIVNGIIEGAHIPNFIVAEKVIVDDYRQDYLVLINMVTRECTPLFEIYGTLDFVRNATPDEIEDFNVFL